MKENPFTIWIIASLHLWDANFIKPMYNNHCMHNAKMDYFYTYMEKGWTYEYFERWSKYQVT